MTFWDYIQEHPIWTLIYLCVICVSIEAVFGGIRRRRKDKEGGFHE